MADLAITISNSIDTFGPAPSTLWGTNAPTTMTWGASKWGEGTADLVSRFEKVFGQTVLLDSAVAISATFYMTLANSVACDSETTGEGLSTGNGWDYVFVKPTTEAELRSITTYSSAAAAITTFTSGTIPVTVWS